MSVYLDEIKQLVELQKVDDERFISKRELENAPKEIDDLEQRFSQLESRRNHILDKLSHLHEQQKRLADEISDDSARLKKSQSKLMQVGNTREHQAVIRELDSMERSKKSREEENQVLNNELIIQNNSLAALDGDYTALKAELEVKREGLEERLSKTKEQLDILDKKREKASEKITPPVLQRYEFIRSRLEYPVIVAVRDGVCNGCHIAVPPQTYIELQRGQQILSCPNCQRLIYWDAHFVDPDQPKLQEAKPAPSKEKIVFFEDRVK